MDRQTLTPYYQDESVTLHHGKALDVVSRMPDQSVDCVVTSPPYFGLRDYGAEGQYGTEETPAEFVQNLVTLYAEVRRVLADDGTFWLNLGDSYANTGGGGAPSSSSTLRGNGHVGGGPKAKAITATRSRQDGLPSKNLLGIPWRVALALQDDGWILRNDIIWNKPNAMPESVADRLSTRHEHIFMFSKSTRYWFDLDPIREDLIYPDAGDGSRVFGGKNKAAELNTGSSARRTGRAYLSDGSKGKNPGDVWSIPTRPFAGAHFAVFPSQIPRRAIASGCKPGGTVLDPCNGSGTTGAAAQALGRKYVGVDINADYLKLTLDTRLQNGVLDLGGAA